MEQKIIAIAAPKGGAGKTTPAINLAYLRAKEIGNENLIVLDADTRTHSARIWAGIRSKDESLMPILVAEAAGGKDFMQQIDLYVKKGYDIIMDIGGDNETELNVALIKAHKIYIPCRVSYMDTFSLSKLDSDIATAKSSWNPNLEAYLFPSIVSTNNLMIADDLKEIKELARELENIKLIDVCTRDRKAFRRSIKYGKTVFELTEEQKFDEKAVEEMNNFYKEVYGK